MILIVDTNVIFAALLKESVTRSLLINSPIDLYTPETAISEIRKYEEEIIRRTRLSKKEFETLFASITERIIIIEKNIIRVCSERQIGFWVM